MIKKFDIIAAARGIVRTNKGYRAPILIHPQRDWWIGIFLFSVLVLVGGGVLARMYMINNTLDALVGAEANAIPRYQEEIVQDVLVAYRERAAAYQTFIGNPPELPPTATTTEEVIDEDIAEEVTEVEVTPAPEREETVVE